VKFLLIDVCLMAVMAAACGSLLAQPAPDAIHLHDAVVIDHPGPVLLSDLLPANTSTIIRNAAASIELCRSPQPGTLRILRAEQVLQSITPHADLFQRLIIPSRITIRHSGLTVSQSSVRDTISEFLRSHGWDGGLPEDAKVDLPEISAAGGEAFAVTHLQWDMQRQAIEVRLRCSITRSCGTFLGYVVLPQTMPGDSRTSLIRAISGSSRPILGTTRPDAAHPPLVAKGKTATLILEDASMRISVPVICLEAGLLN
jgi:hypothetical protein